MIRDKKAMELELKERTSAAFSKSTGRFKCMHVLLQNTKKTENFERLLNQQLIKFNLSSIFNKKRGAEPANK